MYSQRVDVPTQVADPKVRFQYKRDVVALDISAIKRLAQLQKKRDETYKRPFQSLTPS